MFEMLGGLEPGQTLDHLVATVDWRDATPQQVCYAALGRLPQNLHYTGLAGQEFEAGAYFKSLLLGAEFQSEILHNLLAAFPEKPRRFFVHVPRSGGTSLGDTLAAHACTIQHNALGPDWCTGAAFLDSVAALCRVIPQHEQIHIIGHYTLRMIVDARLARFGDSVWTSMRPPQEIILSFINYVLTVIENDPELSRPDTRAWSRQLGLAAPPSTLSSDRLRALLPRMIRQDGLLPRDLLCHFLGDGTAASAIDLLAASNAEVIDSRKLDQWREQRWQDSAQPWANVSRSFFKWSGLGEIECRMINQLIRQDLALHRAVAGCLVGSVSTSGLQIAASSKRSGSAFEAAVPPASAKRVRRAARPILLDPVFHRNPGSILAWSDPPLDYRTIETTLVFPTVETRVRVRYRRRPFFGQILRWPGTLRSSLGSTVGGSTVGGSTVVDTTVGNSARGFSLVPGLGRLVGRVGGMLSRP